jgi:hypothetical protein
MMYEMNEERNTICIARGAILASFAGAVYLPGHIGQALHSRGDSSPILHRGARKCSSPFFHLHRIVPCIIQRGWRGDRPSLFAFPRHTLLIIP